MKQVIILAITNLLGNVLSEYPILMKKLEAFVSDFENTLLILQKGRPTFKVKPKIKTIEEAIKNGHYSGHYNYLKQGENPQAFLYPDNLPEEEIVLGIIPDGEVVPKGITNVEKYWRNRELELVPYAHAYLVQLMADVPEDKMPPELKGKYIVAYTPEANFRGADGGSCRLYVGGGDSYRRLGVAYEGDGWFSNWVFVLRKIIVKP